MNFFAHFRRGRAAEQSQLDRIERKLDQVLALENSIIMTITELRTQVEKNTSVEEGAAALIADIAAKLAAAKDDPAAIQQLADELAKSGADLAAAVAANTPASPAAPAGGVA